jgi:hypothetical protein
MQSEREALLNKFLELFVMKEIMICFSDRHYNLKVIIKILEVELFNGYTLNIIEAYKTFA